MSENILHSNTSALLNLEVVTEAWDQSVNSLKPRDMPKFPQEELKKAKMLLGFLTRK